MKTHWKKAFKSDYLSSSDIDESDITVTIKHVKYQECMTQSGKKFCNVAYFNETTINQKGECIGGVKPMILNVGNSKIVKSFSGHKTHLEDWVNIPVQIYVDSKVRFGNDTVEGLRIRNTKPKSYKELPKITDSNFADAVKFLKAGKSMDELKKYRSIDKAMEDKLTLEANS